MLPPDFEVVRMP